jgi:hypothetical protein
MKITEWLTPGFFEINVCLVTLLIFWTIFSIVSNFLEDFYIPPRVQSANYFGVIIATLIYLGEIMFLEPIQRMYENPYDWLLVGNTPVLIAIVCGVAAGAVLARFLGDGKKIMIAAASLAVVCEALISGAVLLWILNQ